SGRGLAIAGHRFGVAGRRPKAWCGGRGRGALTFDRPSGRRGGGGGLGGWRRGGGGGGGGGAGGRLFLGRGAGGGGGVVAAARRRGSGESPGTASGFVPESLAPGRAGPAASARVAP